MTTAVKSQDRKREKSATRIVKHRHCREKALSWTSPLLPPAWERSPSPRPMTSARDSPSRLPAWQWTHCCEATRVDINPFESLCFASRDTLGTPLAFPPSYVLALPERTGYGPFA